VLNNEDRRALYDHERWLSGRFTRNAAIITPEYILQEIDKLNAHIAVVDIHRMNKELLHHYLLFMLSDEKIAIILLKGKPDVVYNIVSGILKATTHLPFYFKTEVLHRLKAITVNHPADEQKIERALQKLKQEQLWQKLFPWLALAITILLCVAMYLFSKK
jgi:hypothetical protein